jgi:hypothetical protein
MNVPTIAEWATKKGIGLVGSGDFTHPMWLRELESDLEEAGEGIYKLKTPKLKNSKTPNFTDLRIVVSIPTWVKGGEYIFLSFYLTLLRFINSMISYPLWAPIFFQTEDRLSD